MPFATRILAAAAACLCAAHSPASAPSKKSIAVPGNVELAQIKPEPQSLGAAWDRLRQGQVSFAAMLLEIYPEHEIFFLERDARLPGQTAHLVAAAAGEPGAAKRLHFLQVSRLTPADPLFAEYFAQEGISEQTLASGKKILFVDAGFEGSLPKKIERVFPPALRDAFQSHLLAATGSFDSRSPFPRSRTFGAASFPGGFDYGAIHTKPVNDLAKIPKPHGRVTHYEKRDGRIVAIAGAKDADDVDPNEAKAREYVEDTAHYVKRPYATASVAKEREFWRKARALLLAKQKNELVAYLKEYAQKGAPETAMVRDFVELTVTNLAGYVEVSPKEVGVEESKSSVDAFRLLAKSHPELQPLVATPAKSIEAAVDRGDWPLVDKLRAALESATDFPERESNLLAEVLAQRWNDPEAKKRLLEMFGSRSQNQVASAVLFGVTAAQGDEVSKAFVLAAMKKATTARLRGALLDTIAATPSFRRSPEVTREFLKIIPNGEMQLMMDFADKVVYPAGEAPLEGLPELVVERSQRNAEGTLSVVGEEILLRKPTPESRVLLAKVLEQQLANSQHAFSDKFSQYLANVRSSAFHDGFSPALRGALSVWDLNREYRQAEHMQLHYEFPIPAHVKLYKPLCSDTAAQLGGPAAAESSSARLPAAQK